MQIIGYYYLSEPWKHSTGDDIRVYNISRELSLLGYKIIFYCLSTKVEHYKVIKDNNVVYILMPRLFYKLFIRLIGNKFDYDLSPIFKITHYIDEFVAALKIRNPFLKSNENIIYVAGTMVLFSIFMNLIIRDTKRVVMIYDPLANYAQTLHLQSKSSILKTIKYGLFLSLHKLQLNKSDFFIYPSKIDAENAIKMFNLNPSKVFVIPNPIPICYETYNEFLKLRRNRKDFEKPYFVLLAGGRGSINKEAIKITLNIFNSFPQDSYRLIITGPWKDMKSYVKSESIEMLGVVPQNKLKEILAISDYGLAPIFSHSSGTFLKTLAYIASGLNIIATPYALMGIDINLFKSTSSKIRLVNDIDTYKLILKNIVQKQQRHPSRRKILLCNKSSILHVKNLMKNINKVCDKR